MLEENKKISLRLGDVNLESELNSYYIDFRPSKIHYTNNTQGGAFDENGVLCTLTDSTRKYSPLCIIQKDSFFHVYHPKQMTQKANELLRKFLKA